MFLLINLWVFVKSSVLLREFNIFIKCVFIKQIYENKSLSPNHVFTFKVSRFTIFRCLLIILWFFIKIISFLNKIGPLWAAHKGPYVFFWREGMRTPTSACPRRSWSLTAFPLDLVHDDVHVCRTLFSQGGPSQYPMHKSAVECTNYEEKAIHL